MDTFNRHELETLARHQGAWCVSIYLPTDRTVNGMLQNPIRLKNLVNRAEEMLIDHGLRVPEARKAIEPLRELLEEARFWKAVSSGLALFLDAGQLRCYRLPEPFAEVVFVGKRFHIKPLLPLVTNDGRFLLLAISGNSLKMYQGSRWRLQEVSVEGMPENMTSALNYDTREVVRQGHTAAGGGRYGTQLSFHGQGGAPDVAKDEVEEYLRLANRAAAKYLAKEQAPLLFAGVDYLFSIFKRVCSYPHLVPEHISANTETWNHDQLRTAAWEILEPLFRKGRDEAVAECRRLAGSDYELLQLDRVLTACTLGQVDTLLIDPAESCWGTFDAATATVHRDVEPRPGHEELLDLAVTLTLANRGRVFTAARSELPDQLPVAAMLRYPSTATPIPQVTVPEG